MTKLRTFLAANATAALLLASLPTTESLAEGVDAERALVALDGGGDRLAGAVAMLRDSAGRCLRHQAELVDAVKALRTPWGGADPPADASTRLAVGIEEATGLRAARLGLYLVADPLAEVRTAIEESRPVPKGTYDLLVRHSAVRSACIQWSDRTLALLRRAYKGMPGAETDAALGRASDAAVADSATLARLMAGDGPGPQDIRDMMTFGR